MRLKFLSSRRLKVAILLVTLGAVLFAMGSNYYVVHTAQSRVFNDAEALPVNDVGLVLGSSRTALDGPVNPHFKARIDAAAYLYHLGKVKHLLLSGDNHTTSYDEPADMRVALLALGIPDQSMTLDYAGFRTLDSVARAHEVFGLTRLTIITDDFHVYRSVFLASHFGVDAVGYSSREVPFNSDPGPRIREVGARVKAVLDVFVLNRQPTFAGPRTDIKI